MTVAIEIGTGTADGRPVRMEVEELLSTRLLVQGNSGSGKSHLLRRLLEQSAPLVQQAVIDPEGDFVSLAGRFGHLVVDAADHSEAELEAAGERMRAHRISVVLNLEGLDAEEQMRRAGAFLDGMFGAPREHWFAVLVVVDEAQLFAPAVAGEVSDEARRLSLAAMTNLMCRGRKRGLAGVIATQRLAKLAKNVAAEATNFLMGRTFLDIDMVRAADLLGMERRQAEGFRDLKRGEFVALGPAVSRRPLPVRIGGVETESRSAGPSLLPPVAPLPEQERRELVLAPLPETRLPARARRAPVAPPADLLAELAAHGERRAAEIATAEPAPVADPAAIRDQADAIVAVMLGEGGIASRPLPALHHDFLLRARIAGLGREALDLPGFRRVLFDARAGVDRALRESTEWTEVMEAAEELPEDVRPVFLLLARAALRGEPCPSDAAVALAYGTHSPGRARRQLAFLEERGLIVLREDAAGRRSVAMVGSGWQTAPGDRLAALTA